MKGNKIFILLILRISILLVIVALWEGCVKFSVLNHFFFSCPSAITARLVQWLSTGKIYYHMYITALETLFAFLIGTSLGIIGGVICGHYTLLGRVLDPYLKVANSMPRVILAPIFTLWFGIGILSKVALGVTLVFFVVFFNAYQGIKETDPHIVNNVRLLGASQQDLFFHIFLPSTMSWIFASLHTSIGMAMVGAVVGEYLGSVSGLGYIIAQAEGVFDTTGVFSGICLLSFFIISIECIVRTIEKKALKWKLTVQENNF